MNCDSFINNIDIYLEGELNEQDSADFKKHLKSCTSCCDELRSIDKSINVLRQTMNDVKPPESIRTKLFEEIGCCGFGKPDNQDME